MANNVKKDSLVVRCPFCPGISLFDTSPKKNKFSACPHLIASLDSLNKALFISREFANILEIEGLPIKALRDFLGIKVRSGIVIVGKYEIVDDLPLLEYLHLMNSSNYYSLNKDNLLDDFKIYLMNLFFETLSINLREAYCIYSLCFEQNSQKQAGKIRPTFSSSGQINLDWERVPFEIINYIFKELVREQKIKPYILEEWEASKEVDKRALFVEDILYSVEFDNQQILKFLTRKYGIGNQFYSLFRELEFSEEASAIEDIYENMDYDGAKEPANLEYFNEFESSEVLKDLFEKPVWSYASSYEIKGVFVEIRNFLDEIINYLCQQCSIEYDQYTYFSKKLEELVGLRQIDQILKADLIHLHKSQSCIVHVPKKKKENIKRLRQCKNIIKENVLPKFVSILDSLRDKGPGM
jgi:hypothetical protein